jgi:hypothetical protein
MINTEFRAFLVTIFGIPESRIVPLQGNWWNPQDEKRVENWIGFRRGTATPKIKPFFREEDPSVSECYCEVPVRLQIVGAQAEEMAQSVMHWPNRNDVLDALEDLGVQPILEGFGKYEVSDFFQDGGNTVLAYNVGFRLLEELQVETGQVEIVSADLGGALNGE